MAMFLKFIGPMASLTRGKTRFEKNKIYKVLNEDVAWDMLDSGRFQQVRDPAEAAKQKPRGGVRIQRGNQTERGDLSQEDLRRGGSIDERKATERVFVYKDEGSDEEHATTDQSELLKPGRTFIREEEKKDPELKDGAEGEVEEIKSEEDTNPRLPTNPFTSKKKAAEWAQENLGVKLDTSKSIVALNKQIVEIHQKKFGKPLDEEDVDDDLREENTDLEAVTVA